LKYVWQMVWFLMLIYVRKVAFHSYLFPGGSDLSSFWTSWLAMSGFVSVGFTTQTTDIFVCCQHVVNVGPARWRHSVMSANILAVSVVLGNFVADTIFYM
jgi:hypothetical protein